MTAEANLALRDLLSMKIEGQIQLLDTTDDMYEIGDEDAPFFSEAYLYNLLGKDGARTVLMHIRRVCEACGFQMYLLQQEATNALYQDGKTPRTIPPD